MFYDLKIEIGIAYQTELGFTYHRESFNLKLVYPCKKCVEGARLLDAAAPV